MGSMLAILGGTVGVIFFLAVGVIQIIVGYLGIEYHLGSGWAVGAVILSLLLRISFPLTIGTFFGALNVLEWNWFGALLLTVPGIIFMVPGAIGMALAGLADKFGNKPSSNYQSEYRTNISEPVNVTPAKKKKTKKRKSGFSFQCIHG